MHAFYCSLHEPATPGTADTEDFTNPSGAANIGATQDRPNRIVNTYRGVQVSRIKERVEEKEGIPPVQQRLIYGGKQMYVPSFPARPGRTSSSIRFLWTTAGTRISRERLNDTTISANTLCEQGRRENSRRLRSRRRKYAALGACAPRGEMT
jgi:hypothetical protein